MDVRNLQVVPVRRAAANRRSGAGSRPGRCGPTSSSQLRDPDDRGMVTVELAVSILAAVVLMTIAAWTVGLLGLEAACRASAAEIAQQLARGDTAAATRATQNVPQGAAVTTTTTAGWVSVDVTAKRSLGKLGPVTLSGRATTPYEPGETP